jgi:ATP-dependent exoDNAse (exonuclease V) alpha subunit
MSGIFLPQGSVNLKIMLTKDIWQCEGLYSGALGTVRGLVFNENTHPPAQPYFILVEFDEYQGPSVVEGRRIVPIIAEPVPFDARCGKQDNRRQFPLVLGWAITIHKSQGLTLRKVVLGIGDKEGEIGLTYVGCSRVKSHRGLAFKHSFSWERMQKVNRHAGLIKIREEIDRLMNFVT